MNYINIEPAKIEKIVKSLNELLANYQVHYQKLRAFHWNIKGEHFFELHQKFEELYKDAEEKIDEIAERIITMGSIPVCTLKKCLEISSIQETEQFEIERDLLTTVVSDLNMLLSIEKKGVKLAIESEDEATVEILSRFIRQKEKFSWMLFSRLKTETTQVSPATEKEEVKEMPVEI